MTLGAAVAGLGHNGPPVEVVVSPFDAVKTHIDDLLIEARNWADGTKIETQAQADTVSLLISDLRSAEGAAEDARKAEVKPWDDGKKAVQDRYNPLIADLKNKSPGKVPLAIVALKATLQPFLNALEAEKRAEAARVRDIADKAAAAAAEAVRAASAGDLTAREASEDLVKEASSLNRDANRAEKDKAAATGGARAMTLKRTFTPVMTNEREAIIHYMNRQPARFVALAQALAEDDVYGGVRAIPGFDIVEGTKL